MGFVFRGRVDYHCVVFLKPILGKIIIVGHFTLSEFMCPYFDLKKIPIYLIRIAIQYINFESIHKF